MSEQLMETAEIERRAFGIAEQRECTQPAALSERIPALAHDIIRLAYDARESMRPELTRLQSTLAEQAQQIEAIKQQLGTRWDHWKQGASLARCVEDCLADYGIVERARDARIAQCEELEATLVRLTEERDKAWEVESNRIVEALIAFPDLDLDCNDGDGMDSADVADGLRAMIRESVRRAVEKSEAAKDAAEAALRDKSEQLDGVTARCVILEMGMRICREQHMGLPPFGPSRSEAQTP